QLLVVDLQLDRRPRVGAPVRLLFRHWGRGRSIRTSDAARRALGPGAAPTTRRVGSGARDRRRWFAGGPPSSLRAPRPGAGPRGGDALHAPGRLDRRYRVGGAAKDSASERAADAVSRAGDRHRRRDRRGPPRGWRPRPPPPP